MVWNYPNDGKSNTTVKHMIPPVLLVMFDSLGKLSIPPFAIEFSAFISSDSAAISWGPLLLDTRVKSLLHSHPNKEVLSTTLEDP